MWRHAVAVAVLSLCIGCAASPPARPSLVALGNSITHHGPAPQIGWTGEWGMAASASGNDYVAQLARFLVSPGMAARARRFSLTALEANPASYIPAPDMLEAARASDMLVVELGDNVQAPALAAFGGAYARLLTATRPAKGRLFCLSTWWNSPAIDAVIEPACKSAGGTYVFIGDIHRLPGRTGSPEQGLTDPGVLAHPGDRGMADIAQRIIDARGSAP